MMNLSKMQKNQPWTVPYSTAFEDASMLHLPHLKATHAVLHAMKSCGKLAAVFESLDHRGGEATIADLETIADMAADLVTAALRLANLYEFNLEDALVVRVREKNGVGFEKEPSREQA